MSTLHKVKAYFGMAPMDEYEDDYYEDDDRGPAPRGYRRPREDRFEDEGYAPADTTAIPRTVAATTTSRRRTAPGWPAVCPVVSTTPGSRPGCARRGSSTAPRRASER